LEQLGLGHKQQSQTNMNGFKNLDQLHDKDLFKDEKKKKVVFKKYQQQRAQLLPLGGLLGEKIAKSI